MTVRDFYPPPRMAECIDLLKDAPALFRPDCDNRYWRPEIPEASRLKATFSSPKKLFQSIQMPFGLRNTPAWFQKVVCIVLFRERWQSALVYVDEILVYAKLLTEPFVQ